VEVCRLADVVDVLIERQRTVNDHTQTLHTVRCLDVDSSGVDWFGGLIRKKPVSVSAHVCRVACIGVSSCPAV